MKKQYTAPSAEISVFAPTESVAAGWKTGGATGEDRWWLPANGVNYWGTEIPSVPTAYWYDFGTDEIK